MFVFFSIFKRVKLHSGAAVTINNFYLHKFFFNEIKWNEEFICSLLDFIPSDIFILNVNLFVEHFIMLSFDFFLFFFALLTHFTKLYALWFADGSFVLFLIQLNHCDSVLNELWAEWSSTHAHARSFTYFLFPCICRCYLLCFQKSFLVIGDYWRRNKCVCVPYWEASKSWYRIGSEPTHQYHQNAAEAERRKQWT